MKSFLIQVVQNSAFATFGAQGVRFSLVKYSNSAVVYFPLDRYDNSRDITDRIQQLPYDDGRTNITGALKVTRLEVFQRNAGDRQSAPNVLILISDGTPNDEVGGERAEADLLKAAGTTIVSVGITDAIDRDLMSAIASSNDFIESPTFEATDLNRIVGNLATAVCIGEYHTEVFHQFHVTIGKQLKISFVHQQSLLIIYVLTWNNNYF